MNVTAGSISGTMTVDATVTQNAALSYQWYSSASHTNVGGSAITPAGTNSNFSIPTNLAAGIYFYFCEVNATGGAASVRSDVAMVTVAAQPFITINTQPEPITSVTAGSISGSLAVAAAVTPGETLNYQWQQSSQNDFSSATNVGTNNPALAIPTELTAGIYFFRCVINADGAVLKISNTVMVDVAAQPVITIHTQPEQTTNVTAGSINGSMFVYATVAPYETLNYQWQQSDMSDFTGEINVGINNMTFTIPAGLTAGSYYFRCIISAAGAVSIISNTATVIVTAPVPEIIINAQPVQITNVFAGIITGNLSVSATVTQGVPLNYQWQQSSLSDFIDTTNVGTNSPALDIPSGLIVGTYYFRCVVSADGTESKTSNTARVNVAVQPVITIITQPEPVTNVTAGSINSSLSVSATVIPAVPLNYKWLWSDESDFSGTLSPAGTNSPTMAIPAALKPGVTHYFRCVISADGAESKTSDTAAVNVAVQPVITINLQPVPTMDATEGSISGSLSVSAAVTPDGTLNYQWQQANQSNFTGSTNVGINNPILDIPAGLTAGIYYFRCVISADGAISKTSDAAIITVAARPVITINTQPYGAVVTAGSISGN
ncbi:MAG: hypothetical protein FWF29_08860, partial [Treponema sp.]|nr:hypothetical protein [Treponema sp.]